MSTLSGTKREAKSPQRPGDTEEQRKKRKGRTVTANSRKFSNLAEFERLNNIRVLFLLPNHDHDSPEVILPSCKGELAEHFLVMTNDECSTRQIGPPFLEEPTGRKYPTSHQLTWLVRTTTNRSRWKSSGWNVLEIERTEKISSRHSIQLALC
jgi:hypothetical protein